MKLVKNDRLVFSHKCIGSVGIVLAFEFIYVTGDYILGGHSNNFKCNSVPQNNFIIRSQNLPFKPPKWP